MESIKKLFRIGYGPSSSHTMAPRKAALKFGGQFPAPAYRVTLYGSLAASGKGHLTDIALEQALAPVPVEILWKPEQVLPVHPNAMLLQALDGSGAVTAERTVYSVGGGTVLEDGQPPVHEPLYPLSNMTDILTRCEEKGQMLWEFVLECEDDTVWRFLQDVREKMADAIGRGLLAEGVLPGGLGLARKASSIYRKTRMGGVHLQQSGLLSAYALAAAEENAGGGQVVAAPTCGASGVLPAVLRYMQEILSASEDVVLRALATAGLIGNIIKTNASISGARVGCQGEIGAACAMAAGAAAQMFGGTVRQVEYAAEMGLEHFLGLTCDPVQGLVQIPCIERNAFAATRALHSAEYALFTDGTHRVSFDEVVSVMNQTGHDLPPLYRETADGGLAEMVRRRPQNAKPDPESAPG
jgi:L-serine dehydratase